MVVFASGVGAGLLYQKYNKDVMKYMKKAKKTVKDVK
jgi:hypothetical protein